VITRKLVIAGVSALVLSPGVAWACTGNGHRGPYGPTGATGVTGVTGSTGWTASAGTSGVASASLRSAGLRKAHHAHARKSAGRG